MTTKAAPAIQWQDKLREAFSRNAAYGLFIDYQKKFHAVDTHGAMVRGSRISEATRGLGIRNYWVATPEADIPLERTLYKDLSLRNDDAFYFAAPAPDETVFIKKQQNMLTTPAAKEHFSKLDRPVIIAGGLYANKCFGTSVVGLLNLIECDIIVPYDATNFESVDDVQTLTLNISWNYMKPPKGRLHAVSTAEVLEFLPRLMP